MAPLGNTNGMEVKNSETIKKLLREDHFPRALRLFYSSGDFVLDPHVNPSRFLTAQPGDCCCQSRYYRQHICGIPPGD